MPPAWVLRAEGPIYFLNSEHIAHRSRHHIAAETLKIQDSDCDMLKSMDRACSRKESWGSQSPCRWLGLVWPRTSGARVRV
jgi:hypothetical protein